MLEGRAQYTVEANFRFVLCQQGQVKNSFVIHKENARGNLIELRTNTTFIVLKV